MKENQKGVTLIQLVGALIILVIVIVGIDCFKKNIEESKTNKSYQQLSDEEKATLDDWNGVYSKGSYTITLARSALDTINVVVSKYNSGIIVESKTIELGSVSELIYDEDSSMTIEKTDTGIIFNAPDVDDTSDFKGFDGEYEKAVFTNLGWDGVYTKGNYTVVIAELNKDDVSIIISSGKESWNTEVIEYTSEEISYSGTNNSGNLQNLQVIKTDNGIEIEASSDYSDSLLNKIDGEFEKVQ